MTIKPSEDQVNQKDFSEKSKRPNLYSVILHNDDYTTMDFVIEVLRRFFNKNQVEAEQLMLKVHQQGWATCGVFTMEIAETKVHQVTQYAKEHGHPLKCSYEEE